MTLPASLLTAVCPSHKVWQYFQLICSIPHPSRHEDALAQAIVQLLAEKGLAVSRDGVGNIIAAKPATSGLENRPGVILQAHLDMVPQKTPGSDHDFVKDAIKLIEKDGWIKADATTLGADNGIGVAAILAVLMHDDICHGPLEALFTINEESGMEGAHGIESGLFKGRYLLNLDTEEEGELYVGCAGGRDVNADITLDWQPADSGNQAFTLALNGLRGGHSGVDIHENRGNAALLLLELMASLPHSLQLASINAGSVRNAIPRRSFATIMLAPSDVAAAETIIADFEQRCKQQYAHADVDFSIVMTPTDGVDKVIAAEQQTALLTMFNTLPNGIQKMCAEAPDRVETSSNLGVLKTTDSKMTFCILVRSFNNAERDKHCEKLHSHLSPLATVVCINDYPGWMPDLNSPLLAQMQAAHQRVTGHEAKVQMIHAGLECGLLGAKYPNWQMISFGPNIIGAHSPSESVEISTVDSMWALLIEALVSLK